MITKAGPSKGDLANWLASPLSKFVPWRTPEGNSPQADFVKAAATHKKRVFRAGNRLGKTTTVAFDTLLMLTGNHPYAQKKPPLVCWASALDWENMVGTDLWPAFQKLLPMDQVQSIQWYRRSEPCIPRAVMFKNGSRLLFKSADSGRRKYQGSEADILVINEEHPADVVREARRALLTRGGYLSVALTPVERMRWVQDLEGEKGVAVIRASLTDAAKAGIADQKEVEEYLAPMPENIRRLRDCGDYTDLVGAVYPNFNYVTHVAQPRDGYLWLGDRKVCEYPIPGSWPRYASWDFGYSSGHSTAVIKAAHDIEHGRLIIENCWYGSNIRQAIWAERLAPYLQRLARPVACDHDADGRATLEAYGISTEPARKAFDPGIELLARLLEPTRSDGMPAVVLVNDHTLETPRLGRCDAYKVWWEFDRYRYPEDREGRALRADRPISRDDHAMDALRYLCAQVAQAMLSKRSPAIQDGLLRRLERSY